MQTFMCCCGTVLTNNNIAVEKNNTMELCNCLQPYIGAFLRRVM